MDLAKLATDNIMINNTKNSFEKMTKGKAKFNKVEYSKKDELVRIYFSVDNRYYWISCCYKAKYEQGYCRVDEWLRHEISLFIGNDRVNMINTFESVYNYILMKFDLQFKPVIQM